MRNILFVQRPATAPRRRGRRRAAATPSEDLPDGMIYRHATNVPNHVSTFDRARINTSRKLNSLSDTMPAISPSNRQYTYEETDKSIVDLIVRLHEVRSRSDARIFASLWEERIMRIDELEDVVPTTQDDTPTPWAIMPGDAKSLSNEPFMSHGVPIRDAASIIPPTLPRVMSIWISTSRLPTISLSAAGLPTVIHSAAPGQLAYHWVDAPVENADMARFFEGVNWRVEPNASDILGYIFSYGWNDLTRFVSTGRFETHEQTKGNNGCTEHGFRKEAGNNKRLKNVTMEKAVQHKGPDVHFPVHQWQVIGVGWRDFQNDLKDAARKGVKVWRMKVCVVEMPTAE